MPARELRYAVLIGALLVGAALYAVIEEPHVGTPRWPAVASVFTVDNWTVSPEKVDQINGSTHVTRVYQGPEATTATMMIITNQNAKVFGAGAEVPFQGSGYDVAPAPPEVVRSVPGVDALTATRGNERWLVLYAYGEQRGLLGNGLVGWGAAVLDGMLGRGNDYYRLYVVTQVAADDQATTQRAVELAHTVFPRIADWYRA